MVVEHFFKLGEDHFKSDRPILHFAAALIPQSGGHFQSCRSREEIRRSHFRCQNGSSLAFLSASACACFPSRQARAGIYLSSRPFLRPWRFCHLFFCHFFSYKFEVFVDLSGCFWLPEGNFKFVNAFGQSAAQMLAKKTCMSPKRFR